MKKFILCTILFFSFTAFAAEGPTNILGIRIGMNRADYVSAIGIAPIECNTYKKKDEEERTQELELLKFGDLTDHIYCNSPTGSAENIQVGGLSFDVVSADHSASVLVDSIGASSRAIFLEDRLIKIVILKPKVDLDTLEEKYGMPKLVNSTRIESCQNLAGNEFKNKIGNLDAVWVNGEVNAIFRHKTFLHGKTCTEVFDLRYYILEEQRQLEKIEAAIDFFRKDNIKRKSKDSKF